MTRAEGEADAGEIPGWRPAGTSSSYPRTEPREVSESTPTSGLIALVVVVGLPLAGIAWWRHGMVIGGLVLLCPVGMWLAGRLRRRRFVTDMFEPKVRRNRFRRYAAGFLGGGICAWWLAVALGPGSLSADAGNAAAIAFGGLVVDVGVSTGLIRPGRRERRRMAGQQHIDERAIRAARRNGG